MSTRFTLTTQKTTSSSASMSRRSFVSLALGGFSLSAAALTLSACAGAGSFVGASSNGSTEASSSSNKTVTLKSLDAQNNTIDVSIPQGAARVAVMDLGVLDILDSIKEGEHVVGVSQTSIDYLSSYPAREGMVNLGTVKEASLEAVASAAPDVIFTGGRMKNIYDELNKIAPTVLVATDVEKGLVESVRENARMIAQIWDKQDEVDAHIDAFNERIEAIKKVSAGKTAIVGMYTSGAFNVLGNDARCSLIGRELGFTNLAANQTSSTHGNEASFETLLSQNPDYLFVLNRDAAIGQGGAEQAQEIVENDLTKNTTAYQQNHIVYLEHPAVWYTAEGGIKALDIMIQDIENALAKA